jgi:hypothetical protein
MKKHITKFLILTIILTAALSVNYLFAAWVGPTQAPPGGNTSTPIHVGSTNQVKDGGLSVNALSVFGDGWLQGDLNIVGKIKVGNSNASPIAGTIRWTGTDFEGYDGTQWVSLVSGEAVVVVDPNYTDCINVGGSWVDAQGVCYFPNTSCPSGWTQKENYSSTIGKSGSVNPCYGNLRQFSCSTGQHFRTNTAVEVCHMYKGTSARKQRRFCNKTSLTAIRIEIGCEKN